MNDPHVVSLTYRLVIENEHTFGSPPPIIHEENDFSLYLKDGVLSVEMKRHFASERAAREEVDKYLRAWETNAILDFGGISFRFRFENSSVIDRQPSLAEISQIEVMQGDISMSTECLPLGPSVIHRYPNPPRNFSVSADVETLSKRYQAYCMGYEPLPSMAYFCLTAIYWKFRDPESQKKPPSTRAAQKLNVSNSVLTKLGHLSSKHGDSLTARKAAGMVNSLDCLQREWIKSAIKILIRRVAEYDYWRDQGIEQDENLRSLLPEINMSHLPDLS